MTATPQRYQATISCPIVKADDDDKRLVTGIVLQPDVEDAHGDTVTAEVIEEAAHAFVAKYNAATEMGVQHKLFGLPDVHLAESYLAPEDMTIGGQPVLKGTWIITVKVENDELWEGVKDGSLTGFSIGAIATVPAESAEEDEETAKAAVSKDAAELIALEKSRPLLALDVSEVSLVDAAANERKFLVTKALAPVQDTTSQEPPMAAKPNFLVSLSIAKDMGKIKSLSKELALERLTAASSMIETLKSEFDGFEDIGQLWKAVDDIHAMLWPVEGDIHTAVFKSVNEAEGFTLALADDVKENIAKMLAEVKDADEAAVAEVIAKAIADKVAEVTLDSLVTKTIETIKAKSVTPKRLAELGALAEGLTAAIAEMSPAVEDDTDEEPVEKSSGPSLEDIAALLDTKLDPVTKRLDALEAGPEPTAEEQAAITKAAAQEELTKAKDAEAAAKAETARVQKQLEELEAGSTGDTDDTEPDEDPQVPVAKQSIWKSVINQPTRKQRAAAAAQAKLDADAANAN